MGTTTDIKETNISQRLVGKKCGNCDQLFTQEEIDDKNYMLCFDTSNDVKLVEMEKIEEQMDRTKLAKFNEDY